jgi:hypothetical protein
VETEKGVRIVSSPKDWTHWLAIATAVHNNQKNETTGLSPNQILLGHELTLQTGEDTPSNNKTAETRIQNMKEKRAQAIDAINRATQTKQAMMPQYKLGEQVWLKATHLKICHQKTKLKPKRYGPFKIIKEISPVAYQLRLPVA